MLRKPVSAADRYVVAALAEYIESHRPAADSIDRSAGALSAIVRLLFTVAAGEKRHGGDARGIVLQVSTADNLDVLQLSGLLAVGSSASFTIKEMGRVLEVAR